ncbi:MAG: FAD-binding and (Fe-S)-binding domain-containing protein [Mycobacteriales bacterium]
MNRTDPVARLRPVDSSLLDALEQAVPGGVRSRASDRLAMAHDASHYLLTPQAVVTPRSAADVAALLRASAAQGVPLTFRSGGTSLSGQAVGDGVLVDTRRNFRAVEVLDGGARVRVQPGATVREVNARLAPYRTKLGPDPASEAACTIGGVVANNSSGMACGTEFNSYRTLDSMILVLPSGTVVDSAAVDANDRLRHDEPALYAGLLALRDRVRGNAESMRMIAKQFSLKNTMGYSVNAFVDHTDAVGILAHLVIGSEGTLAFVASATFRTVPVHAHLATGLLLFHDLHAATAALPELLAAGPATVELLDAASLRVAQADPLAGDVLRRLEVLQHAALLLEFQESSAAALDERTLGATALLHRLPLALPAQLSGEPKSRAALWRIRKGLYAAVAGSRPAGTTALLEDIAVPVPALADTCVELVALFAAHDYDDSVIFGHAKDGNIHFMLTERFDEPERVDHYLAFTEDMVALVLGRDGTLKAEHGTGRMMAPYVRRQFGAELYEVMLAVKTLCDPAGLLNPGVLIDVDPAAQVANLKSTPTVETEVDRCVECGFCEPVCPSRDLTLTPRQRIVLRRERARAAAAGDLNLVRELDDDYGYDGLDTCATDGMCQTACPVLIDTGALVKRLRAESRSRLEQGSWQAAAAHWGAVTRAAGAALTVAGSIPPALVTAPNRLARALGGPEAVPLWSRDLPKGGRRRTGLSSPHADAVYFPACINSLFGSAEPGAGVGPALRNLCGRAGVQLVVPASIRQLCCGTPWASKGMTAGYVRMQRLVLPALWQATGGGRLPVVCDASSCTEGLQQLIASTPRYQAMRVLDAVSYVDAQVLPALTVTGGLDSIALHPTCSSTRLGANDALLRVAAAVAGEVVVPDDWSCCAFAGDRGLLHPELTASATAPQARAVATRDFSAYASSNRTCEIGMSRSTGQNYRHVLELVDEATRPSDARPADDRPAPRGARR